MRAWLTGCLTWFAAILIIAGGVAAVIAIWVSIAGFLLMLAWNATVPEVLPGPVQSGALIGTLDFFQGVKLALLTTLLFGSGALGALATFFRRASE